MSTIDTSFDIEANDLAGWLERIVSPMQRCELEALTREAILEQRRRTEAAEAAYQDCQTARQQLGRDSQSLREIYRHRLQRNYSHMAVVAALTDRLGYIPVVPAQISTGTG